MHSHSEIATLIARGRYRQALPLAREACQRLEADPSLSAAERAGRLEQLGVLLRELGHYSRAEGPLLQALSARAAVSKEDADYARTLGELGRLYEEQARYSNAEKLLRSAQALREQVLGPDHPDVATGLYDLGKLLDHLGRYAEAHASHSRALEVRRAGLGEDHPDTAVSRAAQAWALWRTGQLDQATEAVRGAVATLRLTRGEDHPDTATCCQFLARICLHQARVEEAEQLAHVVLATRQECLGEEHHRYAGGLENLALIRTVQGRHDEAVSLARQAVRLTRAALGDRHPYVAEGLSALAYALQASGHYEEAEGHNREALTLGEAVLGKDHPHLASCHRDLAEVLAQLQRHEEADTHFRQALTILEQDEASCRVERIETLQGRARLLAANNRPAEAVAVAREAVERARALQRDNGSAFLVAAALDSLARVYQSAGQLHEAEPVWSEVLQLREQTVGSTHPLYAETLRCLAGLHLAQGDFARASAYEEQALAILRGSLGERHPDYVHALCGMAEMHWQRGQVAQAEELFFRAVDIEHDRVGDSHPDHARVLRQLARMYQGMGNFPAAEVRFREVLAIMERCHGEDHPEYATALHDLAALHQQMGDLLTAEGMYQQACEIRQRTPGDGHPDFAQCLHGLATVYQAMGRFDEAAPLFRRTIEIHEQALGGNHLATLRMRHSQALFEQARGDFRRAEDLLAQVRDQLVTVAGPVSPMLVPVLTDQARMYSAAGDHLSAEECWRRILEINQQLLPGDPLLHAQDLLNLALCLRAEGDLSGAEPLVRTALERLDQHRGPQHAETAAAVGLLASILHGLEEEGAAPPRGEAERCYRDALDRTRVALGQAHPAVAAAQVELATYCAAHGRLDEGLTLCQQACDLLRQVHGEDHFEYINQLRTLAGMYQAAGRLTEAEPLLRQRVTILRRLFGSNSAVLVPGQQLLADLYRQQGRLDEAEAMCRHAVETFRRVWVEQAGQKPERPADAEEPPPPAGPQTDLLNLALAENNLATVYLAARRPADAERLLRQAVEDLTRCCGPDHPSQPRFLFQLAWLLAGTGRAAEALPLLEAITEQDNRLLPQLLALETDRVRLYHGLSIQDTYEATLALSVARPGESGATTGPEVRRLYDLVLKRKRLGLELLAAPLLPVWQEKYPEQTRELRRLWLLDRQIGFKRLSGPVLEGVAVHHDLLTAWQEQRDALEQRLARHLPEIALRIRRRQADVPTVAAALPAGWALIDFVCYRPPDFRTLPRSLGGPPLASGGKGRAAETSRYLVFILRHGAEAPLLLDLDSAATLDPLLAHWREDLTAGHTSSAAAAALRTAVWERIAPHVADCRGLVLAPDGNLLHVPLDALPLADAPAGEPVPCLLDRFLTRQVLSGRDLLRDEDATPTDPPVVVAGESVASTASVRPLGRFGSWLRQKLHRGAPVVPAAAAVQPLDDGLPVAERLGVRLWTDRTVKPRLQHVSGPRVLHLALPGRFPAEPAPRPEGWDNPLNGSALVLSEAELLTAHEITRMDLWGTAVVFLSGIDTPAQQPLGWSKVGALAGAFLRSGASSVVLSLWQAPEPARRTLIQIFYLRLSEGQSPGDALRQARISVRASYPAPQAWAGWLCLGEGDAPP